MLGGRAPADTIFFTSPGGPAARGKPELGGARSEGKKSGVIFGGRGGLLVDGREGWSVGGGLVDGKGAGWVEGGGW